MSKATRGERELLHQFWNTGTWAALRAPASGSMRFPSPDLIVGNHSRRLAIECKVTASDSQYFSHKEIDELVLFSSLFGAEPWVWVKFLRKGAYFVSAHDLLKTPKHYVITFSRCESLGLGFEDITRI